MLTTENILFLLLAYLIGAFPSAVWLGRTFYNTDVREYGSGNAGATNTFRTLGAKAGVPVLIQGVGSVFWLSFTTAKSISNYREHALLTDDSKYEDFIRKMLKNGVRLSQNGRWHMSSAHTESDVDKTINAAYESFRDLS